MLNIVRFIDRAFYPNDTDNWDDKLFRDIILSRMKPESTVLDLGAGAGLVSEMNFRGLCNRIYGVDLDNRVLTNAYLDFAFESDASDLPFEDNFFDLVFADNVMEHLADPESVFIEIQRVLKPGGRLLFKTPNRFHYVALIARSTSHSFHRWVNALRGRDAVDTFPTLYLCNSRSQIGVLADKVGLVVAGITFYERRPEYLRLFWAFYLFGILYERVVNAFTILQVFRVLLIAELRKDTIKGN